MTGFKLIVVAVICGYWAPLLIGMVLTKECPGIIRRLMIALAFASLAEHTGNESLCLMILTAWAGSEIGDAITSASIRMHKAALCHDPVTHLVCSEDGSDGFLGCYRHTVAARANNRAFEGRPIEHFDRAAHGCDWLTCEHEPTMDDISQAMARKVRKEAV